METALGLLLLFLPILGVLGFMGYCFVYVKKHDYVPKLERIFEEKPLFIIPRGQANPNAEDVKFAGPEGSTLCGCYFKTPHTRKGVVLFGIEYGSDRWSCQSYCDPLIAAGYDVFAFEPRSQGDSTPIPNYVPLQWITRYEVLDTMAAVAYLKSRPDADPKGIALMGVSKGANAGLFVGVKEDYIRCAVTDGAFGIMTVMLPYMKHWITIYNQSVLVHGMLPAWFYSIFARKGVRRVQRRRKVRFFHLEEVLPNWKKPWLQIHGDADSYIKPTMAKELHKHCANFVEFWSIPKARHNQAIAIAGEEYHARVIAFLDKHLAGV